MKGTNAVHRFLKKNSSTILSFIGAAGVIGTAVLAVSETPKAMKICESLRLERVNDYGKEPTKLEYIKAAAPVYIPSVALGLATITCIFGANVLNKKQQAALISAYGLLDQAYKEYKSKVSDIFGEDANTQIQKAIAREKYYAGKEYPHDEDKLLFYEEHYGKYFERTMEEVMDAEYYLNKIFVENGLASVNDFLELLGLEEIDGGDLIGWETDHMIEFYGHTWINFEHQLVTMDDGLECYIINTPIEPYSIL